MNDHIPFGDAEPDDAELDDARRRTEEMLDRMGISLSDRELWEEPAELDSGLWQTWSEEEAAGNRRRWWPAVGMAAALILVVTIAGIAVLRRPSPDWEVALFPTEAAPQASARVLGWNTEGGTRLYVDIDTLEPAPEGYVYELWFTRDDRHISAGTFTGGDGIEMWVGVRHRDYPRVWITIEPLDGDPTPYETVLDTEA